MPEYVIQFDCAEAILVECASIEDAAEIRDDFGCVPRTITPAEECEIEAAWDKNGWLRVKLKEAANEQVKKLPARQV